MTQGGKRGLPERWRLVRLRDICELNPTRRNTLNRDDDAPTTFVPMSAVDEISGTITRPEIKPFAQVRRGYTYFEESDVLFAKITPCMQNGKQAIARNLIDGFGFGSTEFHVIRPSEQVLPEWIHFYVRQPSLLNNATEFFTGAVGQQRLPESYLASLEIPLPPLSEQQRIAAILAEQMAAVDKARAAVEQQLNAAKQLPAAYLREVFGHAKKHWEAKELGETIKEAQPGFASGKRDENGVIQIRMNNVDTRGTLSLQEFIRVPATEEMIASITTTFHMNTTFCVQ